MSAEVLPRSFFLVAIRIFVVVIAIIFVIMTAAAIVFTSLATTTTAIVIASFSATAGYRAFRTNTACTVHIHSGLCSFCANRFVVCVYFTVAGISSAISAASE